MLGAVRAAAPPEARVQVVVDGALMKAFGVAFADFVQIRDIAADKKDLTRYTIIFDRNATQLMVAFVPKFPHGWSGIGGETPYGREVTYSINANSYAIMQRQFGE